MLIIYEWWCSYCGVPRRCQHDCYKLCIEKERQALLDVKATYMEVSMIGGAKGKKWTNHTGHVIELDLTFYFGLTGKISPSLQVLNRLRYLNLNYIDFQFDHLPNFLGFLSKLQRLDISRANLSGPIPRHLANLSNLLHLDLSWNSLWGSIPFSFGDLTSLTYLDLSQNQLGGVIPKSFGNYSNLEYLNVGHNSLNGSIPNFIRCPSLSFLDLSSNQLSGNVPNSLGQVSNLDFSSNSLKGAISEVHFLNLTQLYHLDLSFNSLALDFSSHWSFPFQLLTIKLQSCKLGPRFPIWIKTQGQFTHLDISNAGISDNVPGWFWDLPSGLTFLNLSSNQMKGMIPDMTSYFDDYPGMDLSNNHFEGRIPLLPSKLASLNLSGNRFSGTLSFLCKIDEVLTFLDLSFHSLSGSVPDCWLKFQESIVVINLSNNKLSGEIPSSLGFLSNLEALYLRANAFVGEVPTSLSNCTQLRFLDLGENKLSGFIPEWIGEKLLELYVLVLGSNRFYGRFPSQVCWLHNLQLLDLSNNGLSGNIPRYGNPQLCGPPLTPTCGFQPIVGKKDVEEDEDDYWKSYYTGMGVGFAVGF
ncbi:hypothetical protein L1987_25061 [Smallanthus sonchifolius]|uniref:Uncharacterized protein n=1 Tax=Smallanthus sonchifolius TaxID=185202 RepID=A0ACB9ILI1_9ASTR|nr:hypothetical protein L1987_25061 [Smallanthus sonchifolius]